MTRKEFVQHVYTRIVAAQKRVDAIRVLVERIWREYHRPAGSAVDAMLAACELSWKDAGLPTARNGHVIVSGDPRVAPENMYLWTFREAVTGTKERRIRADAELQNASNLPEQVSAHVAARVDAALTAGEEHIARTTEAVERRLARLQKGYRRGWETQQGRDLTRKLESITALNTLQQEGGK